MTARPIIGSDIGMPARVTLRREFLVQYFTVRSRKRRLTRLVYSSGLICFHKATRITLPVRSLARNYAQGITDSRPTVPHRCCSGTVPAYLAAVR